MLFETLDNYLEYYAECAIEYLDTPYLDEVIDYIIESLEYFTAYEVNAWTYNRIKEIAKKCLQKATEKE